MKQIIILLSVVLSFTSCDITSSEDYNAKAELLEQEGKFEEAIVLLNKAIELKPDNVRALLNRAVDLSYLEDYKSSMDDYTKIIAIDPNNALALLNRGKNKKRLKNYAGAIDDFNKAIQTKGNERVYFEKVENSFVDLGFEFDVSMEEVRYERGLARYKIHSLKLAFEDFDFCITENFEKAASLYWRGAVYFSFGMKNEGCEDLNEALKLADQDAQILIDKYCK